MRFCVLVFSSLLLTSCAVGPDYRRPTAAELGAPITWRATLPHEGSLSGISEWWKHFGDPALVQLVAAAENNSPTLANAIAKVREARASVSVSRASIWPAVNGTGSVTRGKNLAGASDNPGGMGVSTLSSGSLDASWELDLFGGKRRAVQAAKARFDSAEAGWHDARVTLAAEVANAYTSARQFQNLIALSEQEWVSLKTSEDLVARKIEAGLAPSADSLAMAAATAEAADRLESQRGLFAQWCNQLVMLTGLTYEQIQTTLGRAEPVPKNNTWVDLEMPAKVIAQRPDVRSAESLLIAASAEIGVAVADALPSLSLVGSIGINATRTGATSSTLRTWSFGPAVDIPLFRAGEKAAQIEAARARYDQSLAAYRASVFTAVQEIENASVRIATVFHRVDHVQRAAKNYAAYFTATERSYREGRSSLLELETARRQSHRAQEALISVELEQAQSWIALYKALGGGWPMPVVAARTGR